MAGKEIYSNYHRVSDSETLSDPFENSRETRPSFFNRYASQLYVVALHIILAATYGFIAFKQFKTPEPQGFFTPLDAPVVYEQTIIRTSSFENNSAIDPYAGYGPEVDKKWEELIGVGIVRLTAEETSRLSFTPAKLYGGKEGEHAGFIEWVHQLHCLNRIRMRLYEPDRNLDQHQFDQDGKHSVQFTLNHDSHCFDYLRQNIMCYSDLSVLPIGWDQGHQGYMSPFDAKIEKTCRNFDAIHAWAMTRTPEHVPPGNGGVDLHISNE